MSIKNFSENIFVKSILSSPNAESIGNFVPSASLQIGYIRVLMQISGTFTGERIQLAINPTGKTYASETVLVTDLDSSLSTGSDWFGWVRFDFAKQWLVGSAFHNLTMLSTGYTENQGTKEINTVYDYPVPWTGSRLTSFSNHPAAFQLFKYER